MNTTPRSHEESIEDVLIGGAIVAVLLIVFQQAGGAELVGYVATFWLAAKAVNIVWKRFRKDVWGWLGQIAAMILSLVMMAMGVWWGYRFAGQWGEGIAILGAFGGMILGFFGTAVIVGVGVVLEDVLRRRE